LNGSIKAFRAFIRLLNETIRSFNEIIRLPKPLFDEYNLTIKSLDGSIKVFYDIIM
jgi:hypothetical protein